MASRSQRRRQQEQSKARAQEILSNPIDPAKSDSPAIRALADPNFATLPDSQTLDISLQLQKIIRGQDSLMEKYGESSKEIAAIRAQLAKVEREQAKFEADREAWYQEMRDKAEHSRPSSQAERDKIRMEASMRVQRAFQEASAEIATDKIKFEQFLAQQPKEMITSPGRAEMVNENGQPQMRILPEVISIKNKTWVLQPNVPIEVPKLVADRWRQIQRQNEELSQRQRALADTPEQTVLAQRMASINKAFGSNSDELPMY